MNPEIEKIMKKKVLPVIMSGGSGTRLWPLSTPERPKQFHSVVSENTMIQETVARLSGENFLSPVIICGEAHAGIVAEQLAEIECRPRLTVLEPFGRNTAAVAAIAALCAQEIEPEALILLVPADHIIADRDGFHSAIDRASDVADQHIVTFGIQPERPETGFGYIETGEMLSERIFRVERFLEKPDLPTAKAYAASRRHLWNAGIFLFSPQVMLEELADLAPEILQKSRDAYQLGQRTAGTLRLDASAFAQVPSISIDYAVMEKTARSAVLPCNIGWADVGGFAELWQLGEKDDGGNHCRGSSILIDARNNLLLNEGEVPIAVIGLSDIVVVKTDTGLLICPRDRAQDVKLAAEKALTRKSG